jgi:hypothetical protein
VIAELIISLQYSSPYFLSQPEMSIQKKKTNTLQKLFHTCSFGSLEEVSSSEDDYSAENLLSIVTSQRSGALSPNPSQVYPKSPIFVTPLLPTQPPPLQAKYWTEPSATSFQVRGANYVKDRNKVESRPSLFRLFAVDLIKVSKPILKGFCNHPNERVQQCLKAEKAKIAGSEMPPFIFCVNITVPGTPAYHLVIYFAVDDISLIEPPKKGEQMTAFRTLASRFFFGDSDEFRDSTFKLIPRIVSGIFVVKKAVGSKPTILGKKLKQHYIQNDRFFELIVDVGSDKIAKKVVGLSVGYVSTKCMFLLKVLADLCYHFIKASMMVQ